MLDPENTEALNSNHLVGLTPKSLMNLNLYPRKALELHKFSYQTNQYYQDVMDEKKSKMIKKNSYLAVFRHEDKVWRMDLEKSEYILLKKIFSGVKIGEALSKIKESQAKNISFWFSRWINNGLLAITTQIRH
jgi:hypothetical protein